MTDFTGCCCGECSCKGYYSWNGQEFCCLRGPARIRVQQSAGTPVGSMFGLCRQAHVDLIHGCDSLLGTEMIAHPKFLEEWAAVPNTSGCVWEQTKAMTPESTTLTNEVDPCCDYAGGKALFNCDITYSILAGTQVVRFTVEFKKTATSPTPTYTLRRTVSFTNTVTSNVWDFNEWRLPGDGGDCVGIPNGELCNPGGTFCNDCPRLITTLPGAESLSYISPIETFTEPGGDCVMCERAPGLIARAMPITRIFGCPGLESSQQYSATFDVTVENIIAECV